MTSQVGTLLNGRYRLDAQIGHGGMSTVYRAFDTVLERQVAIKLMHREIASDSDQLERFRREARAVAQLNHPHVVGVIDAGEEGTDDDPDGLSTPYIVFEYVEGETLKDRIRRHGRLPIGESVAYAIEIARALAVARSTTAASALETSGRRICTSGSSSRTCFIATATWFSPRNGTSPVSIS